METVWREKPQSLEVVAQFQKHVMRVEIHHRDTERTEEAQSIILCVSSVSSAPLW